MRRRGRIGESGGRGGRRVEERKRKASGEGRGERAGGGVKGREGRREREESSGEGVESGREE